jgi:hypothetical protein
VCIWDRRADNTFTSARAYVQTAGLPWGEKSTAYGTVAPGSRVLEVQMTIGG